MGNGCKAGTDNDGYEKEKAGKLRWKDTVRRDLKAWNIREN